MMTETQARRVAAFFAKVSFGRSCWTWTGSKQNQKRLNYGLFAYDGKRRMVAHRFAFLLSGRTLKPGEEVGHKCHNHLCVALRSP